MKTYTIKITIQEGSDEWWESNPSPDEVAACIKEALLDYGHEVEAEIMEYREIRG